MDQEAVLVEPSAAVSMQDLGASEKELPSMLWLSQHLHLGFIMHEHLLYSEVRNISLVLYMHVRLIIIIIFIVYQEAMFVESPAAVPRQSLESSEKDQPSMFFTTDTTCTCI